VLKTPFFSPWQFWAELKIFLFLNLPHACPDLFFLLKADFSTPFV